MSPVERHGIESHWVRPDRVYATSVLTPIVGFQPVSNAMGVAAQFIQGPGLAGPGLLQRWRWRKQAQRTGVFYGGMRGAGLGFGTAGILNWLRNLIAGIKARFMSASIQRQLATKAANGQPTVISVDTSPRMTVGAQIVDAVRGLLPMPSVTSPAMSAGALQNQMTVPGAAPTVSPAQAAYAVTPGAADMTVFLTNQWRQGN